MPQVVDIDLSKLPTRRGKPEPREPRKTELRHLSDPGNPFYSRTTLTRQKESEFQGWLRGLSWYGEQVRKKGEVPDPDKGDYDFRGAFLAGEEPDETGRWPDVARVPVGLERVDLDDLPEPGPPAESLPGWFAEAPSLYRQMANEVAASSIVPSRADLPGLFMPGRGSTDFWSTVQGETAKEPAPLENTLERAVQEKVDEAVIRPETRADRENLSPFYGGPPMSRFRLFGTALHEGVKDWDRAMFGMVESVATSTEELFGAGESVAGFMRDLSESPNFAPSDKFQTEMALADPGTRFAANVARNLPQVGANVGAAVSLGAPAGMSLAASYIFGGTYGRLVGEGVPHDRAVGAALMNTVGQMPFEYLALGRFMRAFSPMQEGMVRLKAVVEAGLANTIQEYFQEYPEALSENFAKDPDSWVWESLNEFMTSKFQMEALYSGAIGAAIGVGVSAPGAATAPVLPDYSQATDEDLAAEFAKTNLELSKQKLPAPAARARWFAQLAEIKHRVAEEMEARGETEAAIAAEAVPGEQMPTPEEAPAEQVEDESGIQPLFDEAALRESDVDAETISEYLRISEGLRGRAEVKLSRKLKRERLATMREIEREAVLEAERVVESDRQQQVLAELRKGEGINIDLFRVDYPNDVLTIIRRRPGILRKNAPYGPDEVAQQFGMDADELVELLVYGKTKREFIDEYVAGRMKEYEGARKAFGFEDDVRRLLEMEIDFLQRKLKSRDSKKKRMEYLVREEVGRTRTPEDLKLEELQGLKRKFQREGTRARKLMKEGDIGGAREALMLQRDILIVADEITRLRDAVKSAHAYFGRVLKNKNIDWEYRQRIREFVEQFDMRFRSEKTLEERESFLAWYYQETQDGEVLDIPKKYLDTAIKKPANELSINEVLEVRKYVETLEAVGKTKNRLRSTAQKRTVEKTAIECAETAARSAREQGRRHQATDQALSPSERAPAGIAERVFHKLNEMVAPLWRPEFIFAMLDGWTDTGPNQELFNLVKHAQDKSLTLGEEMSNGLMRLFKPFRSSVPGRNRWSERVDIPELPGENRRMTREELVCFALNCGNAGNLAAIKHGYGERVRDAKGNLRVVPLTDAQVQGVLDRLTTEERDLVRDIWREIHKLWKHLDATYREMTTRRLPKVEGIPVAFSDGTVIQGGYYPLRFDGELAVKAERFNNEARLKSLLGVWSGKPEVEASAAHPRQGGKMAPLLSFNVLAQHVRETVHYVSFATTVRDVYRVLMHPIYRETVSEAWGKKIHEQLVGWIEEVAEPGQAGRGIGKPTFLEGTVRRLRIGTTVAMLGLKFSTAAKQILSYTQTIDEVGFGPAMRAFGHFLQHPLETRRFVRSKSVAMRSRARTWDREISYLYSMTGANMWLKNTAIRDSFFVMLRVVDMCATLPTWMAGYHEGLKKFQGDEGRAVDFADQVVRRTQDRATPIDLPAIQRGGELQRMFTMFYTFFSVFQNRAMMRASQFAAKARTGELRARDMMDSWKSFVWLLAVPALLEWAISRRDIPDKKEAALALTTYGVGGLPFVRDIVSCMAYGYGYEGSPVFRGAQELIWAQQALEKDDMGRFFEHAIEVAGYWYALPTQQAMITFDGMMDLATGDTKNPFRLLVKERRQ